MNYEEYTDDGTMNDSEVRMLRRLERQILGSQRRELQQGSGRYEAWIGNDSKRWYAGTAGAVYYGDSLAEVLDKSNLPWIGWHE